MTALLANLGRAKAYRKYNRAVRGPSDKIPRSIPSVVDSEEAPDLQFVNTVSATITDELSKRVIRRHASLYAQRATRPSSSASLNSPAKTHTDDSTPGQVHRFRLGRQGLKQTLNQPRQVTRNFTILRSDEQPSAVTAAPIIINTEDEEDESCSEFTFKTTLGQTSDDSSQEVVEQLVIWGAEQQRTWLEMLLSTRGISMYGPSSSAMDPFNAMSLNITSREQILLRYCFVDRREADSPIIPYCKAFFGLAVQDKAAFHAVLSHYSAIYRLQFQHESLAESISHLSAAIQIITPRLQDPRESCSNGTIGAVASLILYEHANGSLPNIKFHMRGLTEMVRRRGGFKHGDFPMDLKRLIAWTDLNTANDLWQPPRFPPLQLPLSTDTTPETNFPLKEASQSEPQYMFSTLLTPFIEPNIEEVLEELRSFITELTVIARSPYPLNRPGIEISDRIHSIERQFIDLIHNPPTSQNALDHSCAIAALIYMRSNVQYNSCNFRIVETAKLQIALQSLLELADSWKWGMEMRSREKLVWAVGFGAVSSGCGPERPWFVRVFRDICDAFELEMWEHVKVIFETVLWKDELDDEGKKLWEEIQMI